MMTSAATMTKQMTPGEVLGMGIGVACAALFLFIAARTDHSGYAFHASVALAASVASVFAIANRYFWRFR